MTSKLGTPIVSTRPLRSAARRSTLAFSVCLCLGAIERAQCQENGAGEESANVQFSGGLEDKFKNIDGVLQNLLQTLDTPEVWGPFWNERVRLTGKINLTDYPFHEIANELKTYLTDGSLEFEFRTTEAVGGAIVAAHTPGPGKIVLYQYAGRAPNANMYSDYYLARTIFHELMHIFQHRKMTALGREMAKEDFPTDTEKRLPTAFFSTEESKDPGDTTPLPTEEAAADKPTNSTAPEGWHWVASAKEGGQGGVVHTTIECSAPKGARGRAQGSVNPGDKTVVLEFVAGDPLAYGWLLPINVKYYQTRAAMAENYGFKWSIELVKKRKEYPGPVLVQGEGERKWQEPAENNDADPPADAEEADPESGPSNGEPAADDLPTNGENTKR